MIDLELLRGELRVLRCDDMDDKVMMTAGDGG